MTTNDTGGHGRYQQAGAQLDAPPARLLYRPTGRYGAPATPAPRGGPPPQPRPAQSTERPTP
jgi:hypothetical protein